MSNLAEGAGGFLQAFVEARNNKEEKERLGKRAKLEGQLLEMQIAAGEKQAGAQTELSDLMAGTGPVSEIQPADDKLSPGGRPLSQFDMGNDGPKSFSKLFAESDPKFMALLQQTGIDPLKIQQEQRLGQAQKLQEDMFAKFGGMFGGGGGDMVPTGLTIGPDGRPTMSFGPNPEAVTPQQATGVADEFGSLVSEVSRAGELMKGLEGTQLEAGAPGRGASRIATAGFGLVKGFFGLSREKQQEILAQNDELEKILGRLGASALEAAGASTDVGRRTILQGQPGVEKVRQANEQVSAALLEEAIADADRMGIPLRPQDRAAAEKFIAAAHANRITKGASDPTVIDVAAIAKMTKAQVTKLIDKASEMTDEQLRAAAKRLREINADE